jgi:putative aldouronate transport system substrate-binding protein
MRLKTILSCVALLLLFGAAGLWATGVTEAATGEAAREIGWRDGPDLPLWFSNYTQDIDLPLTAEKTTLTVATGVKKSPLPDLNDYWNYQELERRTNVHVDWMTLDVKAASYQEFYRALFAAGANLPDLVEIAGGRDDVVDYYEAGLILPVDQLIYDHAPDLKHLLDIRPSARKQMYHPDGRIPALNGITTSGRALAGMMNVAWLEALNLERPKTLDDFEDVFQAFTYGDPNGNGVQDEFAWYVHQPYHLYRGYLGWLFGMSEIWSDFVYDDEGNVTYYLLLPQTRDAIAFIHKAYQEKWFPTLMVDDPEAWGPERHTWKAEPHGFEWGWAQLPSAEGWEPMAPPQDVSWTQYYAEAPSVQTHYWTITKDAEDPVLAIKWLDYLFGTPDGFSLMWMGEEGEEWYERDGVRYRRNRAHFDSDQAWDAFRQGRTEEVYVYQDRTKILPRDMNATDPTVEPQRVTMAEENWSIIEHLVRPSFPSAMIPADDERVAFDTWRQNGGDQFATQTLYKFISGKEPMENWDQFIDQLKRLGVMEYQQAGERMYTRFLEF